MLHHFLLLFEVVVSLCPFAQRHSSTTSRQELHTDHFEMASGSEIMSVHGTCIVCAEGKPTAEFPTRLASRFCSHTINTCARCTETAVTIAIQSGMQRGVKCPECPQSFELDAAQLYMDEATFQRYGKVCHVSFQAGGRFKLIRSRTDLRN